jgi:hypothetical protein
MNQLDWPAPAPRCRKAVSVRQEAGSCHVRIHQLSPLLGKNILNGQPSLFDIREGVVEKPVGVRVHPRLGSRLFFSTLIESAYWEWAYTLPPIIAKGATLFLGSARYPPNLQY